MANVHFSGPLYVADKLIINASGQLVVHTDLLDIVDANGNELLEWDYVASATNYLRVANAATGNDITLSAQGDTNANMQLSGSGTGLVLLGDFGSATVVSTSATVNAQRGKVVFALAATSGATDTFILKNNLITKTSQLFLQLSNPATLGITGSPVITAYKIVDNGSANIYIYNPVGGVTLSGTANIEFLLTK